MSSTLHEECVPPHLLELAGGLAGVAPEHGLVLGGGTACALRLGHRSSADLDLFAVGELDPPALLADLERVGDRRSRGISDKELALVVGGVEVSAAALGREPLAPPDRWRGLDLLSSLDLAELKVEAAVRRGMARDLCDLHLLCAGGVDLETAIRAGPEDAVPVLKALTDPERFAHDPPLDLRVPWTVEDATGFFAAQARRILG